MKLTSPPTARYCTAAEVPFWLLQPCIAAWGQTELSTWALLPPVAIQNPGNSFWASPTE
jgi:hypothetical protein